MRFETFVALRYLRGKRKNRFISLITIISMAGVSVGVMTLIIVMGVMTGFEIALRDTIIGNRAHLQIFDLGGDPIEDVVAATAAIETAVPQIRASGPFIQAYAVFESKGGWRGDTITSYGTVLGVDPELESAVTDLAENLTLNEGRRHGAGTLPGFKEIVLGYGLAHDLGVHIGDRVSVITPRSRVSPFGMTPAQNTYLRVSGISHAKMSDFDTFYSWVNIETAELLTGKEGVDGIHSRIDNPFDAERFARTIEEQTPFRAVTWHENQLAFFEALKQEQVAMFIILVFIVLVAAFNITSTLIMMVMEKQRDIGILRTIGVSSAAVLRLFMIEGLLIGLFGTFFGVLFGMLLAYNLNPVAEFLAGLFGVDLFNSQIYYFDRIPVHVVPSDVFWITVCAVVLSFVSTLYPAWSASRLDPVDALRYE